MKIYRPPISRSALYILEIDDKSSFSMSGHVGPLEALVQLRIRPTSSSRVLGFTATDSALTVLFHDYRMMWVESTLPVGPNLKLLPEDFIVKL